MGNLISLVESPQVGRHFYTQPDSYTLESWTTFSIGIHQWVPRKNGEGIKAAPASVRILGLVSNTSAVYAKALEVLKELDAGTYSGPKKISLY